MANQAQIKKVLQRPYDLNLFAKEVLSPVFGSHFQMSENPIPASIEPNTAESKVIQKVFIYGKIELKDGTDITCYEIHLHPQIKIEYSKIAIQRYARKLLTIGQAALVNFVIPSNKNIWRLTFIAKESDVIDGKVTKKETNAKRYTYLLGTYESCKTAAERFEILSDEKSLTMETLTKAFSVEKLSKAFFEEYLRHYNNFVNYLNQSTTKKTVFNDNEKAIRDFSKKLLGRIVFLYFVQKKGWLGATNLEYTDGLQNFIFEFYSTAGMSETFYNDHLKTLFFDTLNKKRENDNFTMPDGSVRKIPFLNGGLFDKEDIDDNKNILTFKADFFHNVWDEENPKTRGFLDFLNAYNFTVYEDSPDEQTVAVDPEMLGHIFENLLEDNKDKGAYYTPKEIVHYMCQESLSEYLATNFVKVQNFDKVAIETLVKQKEISTLTKPELQEIDKLLDAVKICDPAIGSGAFPVGLLQEIFTIKEVIAYETEQEWKPAIVKENIIQNSIYGVDIEKGAVDIARLRFWLSLVVDEEKPKALPNLDYKIVVGNSLVSKFEDEIIEIDWKMLNNPALKQSRPDLFKRINDNTKNIHTTQFEFFHSTTDKNELKLKIRNLKIDLLETLIEIEKQILKEKGINRENASNKKQTVEITERKIKYEGFNRMLEKLKDLKKHPEKPLNYFDWQLDFPEILNLAIVNGNGNDKISENVENTNAQIVILNKQIDAINLYLKQINIEEHIVNLQTNIAQSQITLVKELLEKINKTISVIYGELFKVEKNIVSEPNMSFVYKLKSINAGIKEINKSINKINPQINKPKENGSNAGFDIVIGNPPYIDSENMVKKQPIIREHINKKFETAKGNWDIYIPFHELALKLLNKNGVKSFITPNKWLSIGYGQKLRELYFNNFYKICDCSNIKVFDAGNSPIISFFKSIKSGNMIIDSVYSDKKFSQKSIIEKKLINIDNLGILLSDKISIILKIKKQLSIVKDYIDCENPFTTGEAYQLIDILEDTNTNSNDFYKLINTGTIDPYISLWGIKTTTYLKNKYTHPVVSKLNFKKLFPKRVNQANSEKIIISGMRYFECFFDINGEYIAGKSTLMLRNPKKQSNFFYLMGILNSKLVRYFLKQSYSSSGIDGGINFTKDIVDNIPIPKISETAQAPFIKLVDEILAKKKTGEKTDHLEREIDEMVYKLYELTDEEIKIVEGIK